MRPSSRRALTLLELLIVLAVTGGLASIVVQAVQRARAAAATAQCANNLKQIGLALHSYHDTNGSLPSGLTFTAPTWYWSWMAMILPYGGQGPLYNTAYAYASSTGGYTSFVNPVESTVIPHYICPADPNSLPAAHPTTDLATIADYNAQNLAVAFTTYLGVAGNPGDMLDPAPEGPLYRNSHVKFSQITDGLSRTFMVGERPPSPDKLSGWWFAGAGYDYADATTIGMSSGVGDHLLGAKQRGYLAWVEANYPGTHCPASYLRYQAGVASDNCDQIHFWSHHSSGSNFLYADGSVHFINYNVGQGVFAGMCTIAGGEPATLP